METVIARINDQSPINHEIKKVKKEIKDSIKLLRREDRTDEIAQLMRELNNYLKLYPTYEENSLQVGNMSNIPQYKEFKSTLEEFEVVRFNLSVATITVLIIVAILSWSTTCFKQSAVFIVSIVLSFIALLILHLAFGISLAFSIGLSDFCITPASFVEDAIVKLDWLNENEVNFFLKCNTEHKKYEKIQKLSLELEDKKDPIIRFMSGTSQTSSPDVSRSLSKLLTKHNTVVTKVKDFEQMMDCQTIKSEYDGILNSACNNYLLFWWILTFLIAGCLTLICICLVVLPMVMSKTISVDSSEIEFKSSDYSRSSRTFGSLRSAPIPQHDTVRKKTQPSPEIDMYEYDAGYTYGDHHQSFNSNVYLIDHDPKKSQFI